MPATPDEILNSALALPETDRLVIAARLLDTVPEEVPGLSIDDPELLDELERRFQERDATIPVSELWNQD